MEIRREQNARVGVISAVLANLIFGLTFLASRIVLEYTTPAMMLIIRFGMAAAVMLMLVGFGAVKVSFRGKPLGRLLLLGFFQPIIYFIGESYGIKYTNSSFAGIMIAFIPVVAAVLSAVVIKEKLNGSKLLWTLISVSGVVVISVSQTASGSITTKGVLFMVVAVLGGAAFTVTSRSIADDFSAFERTLAMMVLGFVFFMLFGLVEEKKAFVSAFVSAVTSSRVMLPELFLSVIASVGGFVFMNTGIANLPVQQVMIFSNITPIVSLTAGVVVLSEPCTPIHLIGIAVILVGIYMVNRK